MGSPSPGDQQTGLTAVFRADASSAIGVGHVTRCLTLAAGLSRRGWRSVFVCRDQTTQSVPGLAGASDRLIVLDAHDDASAMMSALPAGCDLLVVDHYGWGRAQEERCRGWARRTLVIDDLADRGHDCDFLLDQTLGRSQEEYRRLVGPRTRPLLGSRYALLRPQFRSFRVEAVERHREIRKVRRILVSLGGTDPHDISSRALRAIDRSGLDVEVDIVMGKAAQNLPQVRELAGKLDRPVRVLTDVADMAGLMIEADVAIGASGTSSWERCCMGLPSLVVITAENQRQISRVLADAEAIHVLGRADEVTETIMCEALNRFASQCDRLAEMSRRAAAICDGLGELRVVIELLPPTHSASGRDIRLRFLDVDDADITFAWQCDRRTRRYFRNPSPPSFDEHRAWLLDRLNNEHTFTLMVLCSDDPAGVLRLDRSPKRRRWEVSIYVDPERYRQGVGSAALSLVRNALPNLDLWAQIVPENRASVALYTRLGYEPMGGGWYRNPPVQIHASR